MLFWWLDGGTSWKQRAVRQGTGAATSSTSANPTTGQKEHRFIDSNGAVHPTQYLSTEFNGKRNGTPKKGYKLASTSPTS